MVIDNSKWLDKTLSSRPLSFLPSTNIIFHPFLAILPRQEQLLQQHTSIDSAIPIHYKHVFRFTHHCLPVRRGS